MAKHAPGGNSGRAFYNPALDGLRFFAFFLVFLDHAPWTPVAPPPAPNPWFFLARLHDFGWIGVDLFLCLSSYLITRLLWMEWKEREKVSILDFYCRRALRIWPLYYLMCFTGFFLMPAFGQDGPAFGSAEYGAFLKLFLLPHLAFYANIATALHHNYVQSLTLGPLWTISLEEQFYLLCPILLVAARFDKKKILAAGLVLLAATTVARFLFVQAGFSYPALWVSLPTRLDPFILGALLALFEEDLGRMAGKTPSWLFTVLGLICVLGAMSFPNLDLQQPSVAWLFSLLDLGWVFLLFSIGRPGWPQRGATWGFFPRWGKISYGLYVYHRLALHLAGMALFWFQLQTRLPLHSWTAGWIVSAGGFLLTLALASVSYDFYEKPFLKLKEKFTFIRSRAV